MPDFSYTANLLQEIPEDAVFVEYRHMNDLVWFATALNNTGHTFIVHPTTQQVAFAKSALKDIEGII